jgi:EAL domain-containing protein (putative c-di-GMP-specific phosphodiesterase class I)
MDRFRATHPHTLIARYVATLPASEAAACPLFRSDESRVAGRFFNCRVSSVFQPIVELSQGRVAGHHGLLRIDGQGEAPLAPWGLFALAAGDAMLRQLDRLCRTLHALNYFPQVDDEQWLFLNVEPRLLATVPSEHGKVFERILAKFGLTPRRIVIDLPRSVIADPWLLERVARNYSVRGYRVAVPVDSWDEATLRLLEGVSADIVKVDVRLGMAPRRLKAFAAALRERGILLLARRIETAELLQLVAQSGADLAQGYYLGVPKPVAGVYRCHRSHLQRRAASMSESSALCGGRRRTTWVPWVTASGGSPCRRGRWNHRS